MPLPWIIEKIRLWRRKMKNAGLAKQPVPRFSFSGADWVSLGISDPRLRSPRFSGQDQYTYTAGLLAPPGALH